MTHLAVEKLALVEELSVAFLRYELGRGDKDSVSVCCRNAVSIWSVLRTKRSKLSGVPSCKGINSIMNIS